MFCHSTNTASFFSVLIAALIFSLSLARVAAAQGNTSLGTRTLQSNTTGSFNTAIGHQALLSNTTGDRNTASGVNALVFNTIGDFNTASGVNALLGNTIGDYNTASGAYVLFSNTPGGANAARGTRRWTQTPQQQTRESEAAISTLKIQTTKLKENDAQIETLLSRLEALTRVVLASGHLSNSERVNAFLPALRP
jgi:hypothetical protein